MQYCEDIITGIDGSEATFVRYVLDNSEEIDPKRQRPSVLVIPGGGYAMTSDREAEPIAMQFLAAGCNAFVLRYSVAPSVFPTALLEAAEAVQRIRAHADDWHCDPSKIAVIGFSAGGHLAANLATTAGDDTMRAHGYDPDAVRPNALMLGYPVITSGPLAHRGSFDCLLGDTGGVGRGVHRTAYRREDAARIRMAYHHRRLRTGREHADVGRCLQEGRRAGRGASVPPRRAWSGAWHCGNGVAGG